MTSDSKELTIALPPTAAQVPSDETYVCSMNAANQWNEEK